MSINGFDVKSEIAEKRPKGEERLALLSGFARSCFTLRKFKDSADFEFCLDCQTELVRDYISALVADAFMVRPKSADKNAIVYGDREKLPVQLCLIDDGGDFYDEIPERFAHSAYYARGVFLGCGSMSAPQAGGVDSQKSMGYHLEFAFDSENFADSFASLLGGYGITARKSSRTEKTVIYVKDSESVSDCLALLGAEKTVLRLNETVAVLAVKRDVARLVNCEVANAGRTADASAIIKNAIDVISRTRGLDSLDKKLKDAVAARLEDMEAPLASIAARLGISKSGLKHRFDRLTEIAREIDRAAVDETVKEKK